MYCKNCGFTNNNNAVVCVKCGFAKGTGNKFCGNCGTQAIEGAVACVNCGGSLLMKPVIAKSKLTAGLLAIFIGTLGIHNFYLGYTGKAVTQLLVSTVAGIVTCGISTIGIAIWALVEGILILTGSIDRDGNGNLLRE